MSREELGDDDARSAVPSQRVPLLAPPAPAPDPSTDVPADLSPAARRRIRAALLAVVLVLAGTTGWIGGRAWGGSVDPDAVLDGPIAWAAVVGTRPLGGSGNRALVEVVVRVTNLGRTPLILTGAEASFDAGAIEVVSPDSLPIPPGGTVDAVARASVACRSPQPLRLYPLQVRRSDHSLHSIEIVGSAAALTRVCHAQGPTSEVLTLVRVTEDGERLRLVVRSPTGRTTKVTGVHAGGVTFTGRPLDGAFDARERIIWLDRPRTCPSEWLSGGLPRTLTFELDPGGPAALNLDAGYALARWLRAGPCAGGRL